MNQETVSGQLPANPGHGDWNSAIDEVRRALLAVLAPAVGVA